MTSVQDKVVENPRSAANGDPFAQCEELARSHYENFPVGSFLIPKARRKYVYCIYAFARTADDFADEGYGTGITIAERLALLDDWESQLHAAYDGSAENPIFAALAETVRDLDLPRELFVDLLSAFRQDVTKNRYADFDEILDYCRRSANPIGRLILLLFDYRDPELHRLSDSICTALQLANFWQDVSVDLDKNRIYLPQNEIAEYGVSESQLFDRRFDERFAGLLKHQIGRTRSLFARGQGLPMLVKGRLRYELRMTWLGGMRILSRIEAQRYDTLNKRPEITFWDKLVLAVRTFTG